MNTKYFKKTIIYAIPFVLLGCQKEFLDAIPDKSLLVPTTVSDMQALLDNNGVMNVSSIYPMITSDEFYSVNTALNSTNLNAYTWSSEMWIGDSATDWSRPFSQIFYANIILDGLGKKQADLNGTAYNLAKGSALFFRATAYFGLLQQFSKPYLQSTADKELGMPLRFDSDVNKNPQRASLSQSYEMVIADLALASELLPNTVLYKTRPSKSAAYAMLAKTYLVMNNFIQAENFASKSLQINSELIDYNSLNSTLARPMPHPLTVGNPEVIFWQRNNSALFFTDLTTLIVDSLYASYNVDDLRRSVFFNTTVPGKVTFKGSLSGTTDNFTGIANDEIYLIRAECAVRNDKISLALSDLNTLLSKRFKTGKLIPYTLTNKKELLKLILTERFKQLIFRGNRWSDLRRYNAFDKATIMLNRSYLGISYQLPPNDGRYVFPIPSGETALSGVK